MRAGQPGRRGRVTGLGSAWWIALSAVAAIGAGAAGAAQPDLQVLSVSVDPGPAVGSTIAVGVTLWNAGDADASNVPVGLFLDSPSPPAAGDTPDMLASVNVQHGPGGLVILVRVDFAGVTSAVAATWQMYVVVDCLERVDESDEGNNVAGPVTVEWTEGGSDLVVMGVTPSGSGPLAGDTIQVDVVVRNRGTRDSCATTVSLFYDEPSPPALGEVEDDTRPIPQLDAG